MIDPEMGKTVITFPGSQNRTITKISTKRVFLFLTKWDMKKFRNSRISILQKFLIIYISLLQKLIWVCSLNVILCFILSWVDCYCWLQQQQSNYLPLPKVVTAHKVKEKEIQFSTYKDRIGSLWICIFVRIRIPQ